MISLEIQKRDGNGGSGCSQFCVNESSLNVFKWGVILGSLLLFAVSCTPYKLTSSPEGTITSYVDDRGVLVYAPRSARAQKIVFDTPDQQLIHKPDTPLRKFFDSHASDFRTGGLEYAKTTILSDIVHMVRNKEFIREMIHDIVFQHLESAIAPSEHLIRPILEARGALDNLRAHVAFFPDDKDQTKKTIREIMKTAQDAVTKVARAADAACLGRLKDKSQGCKEREFYQEASEKLNLLEVALKSKLDKLNDKTKGRQKDESNGQIGSSKPSVTACKEALEQREGVKKKCPNESEIPAILRQLVLDLSQMFKVGPKSLQPISQIPNEKGSIKLIRKRNANLLVNELYREFEKADYPNLRQAEIERTMDDFRKKSKNNVWDQTTILVNFPAEDKAKRIPPSEDLARHLKQALVEQRYFELIINKAVEKRRSLFKSNSSPVQNLKSTQGKLEKFFKENLRSALIHYAGDGATSLWTAFLTNLNGQSKDLGVFVKPGEALPLNDTDLLIFSKLLRKNLAGTLDGSKDLKKLIKAVFQEEELQKYLRSFDDDQGNENKEGSINKRRIVWKESLSGSEVLQKAFARLKTKAQELKEQNDSVTNKKSKLEQQDQKLELTVNNVRGEQGLHKIGRFIGHKEDAHEVLEEVSNHLTLNKEFAEHTDVSIFDKKHLVQHAYRLYVKGRDPKACGKDTGDTSCPTNIPSGEKSNETLWVKIKGQHDQLVLSMLQRKNDRERVEALKMQTKNFQKPYAESSRSILQYLSQFTVDYSTVSLNGQELDTAIQKLVGVWREYERNRTVNSPTPESETIKTLSNDLQAYVDAHSYSDSLQVAVQHNTAADQQVPPGDNIPPRSLFRAVITENENLKNSQKEFGAAEKQFKETQRVFLGIEAEKDDSLQQTLMREINANNKLKKKEIDQLQPTHVEQIKKRLGVILKSAREGKGLADDLTLPKIIEHFLNIPLSRNVTASLETLAVEFALTFRNYPTLINSDEPIVTAFLKQKEMKFGSEDYKGRGVKLISSAFVKEWRARTSLAKKSEGNQRAENKTKVSQLGVSDGVALIKAILEKPEISYLFGETGSVTPIIKAFSKELYNAFKHRIPETINAEQEADYSYWWLTFYPKAIPLGDERLEGQSIIEVGFPKSLTPEEQYHRWLQDRVGGLCLDQKNQGPDTNTCKNKGDDMSTGRIKYRLRVQAATSVLNDFLSVLDSSELTRKYPNLRGIIIQALSILTKSQDSNGKFKSPQERYNRAIVYLYDQTIEDWSHMPPPQPPPKDGEVSGVNNYRAGTKYIMTFSPHDACTKIKDLQKLKKWKNFDATDAGFCGDTLPNAHNSTVSATKARHGESEKSSFSDGRDKDSTKSKCPYSNDQQDQYGRTESVSPQSTLQRNDVPSNIYAKLENCVEYRIQLREQARHDLAWDPFGVSHILFAVTSAAETQETLPFKIELYANAFFDGSRRFVQYVPPGEKPAEVSYLREGDEKDTNAVREKEEILARQKLFQDDRKKLRDDRKKLRDGRKKLEDELKAAIGLKRSEILDDLEDIEGDLEDIEDDLEDIEDSLFFESQRLKEIIEELDSQRPIRRFLFLSLREPSDVTREQINNLRDNIRMHLGEFMKSVDKIRNKQRAEIEDIFRVAKKEQEKKLKRLDPSWSFDQKKNCKPELFKKSTDLAKLQELCEVQKEYEKLLKAQSVTRIIGEGKDLKQSIDIMYDMQGEIQWMKEALKRYGPVGKPIIMRQASSFYYDLIDFLDEVDRFINAHGDFNDLVGRLCSNPFLQADPPARKSCISLMEEIKTKKDSEFENELLNLRKALSSFSGPKGFELTSDVKVSLTSFIAKVEAYMKGGRKGFEGIESALQVIDIASFRELILDTLKGIRKTGQAQVLETGQAQVLDKKVAKFDRINSIIRQLMSGSNYDIFEGKIALGDDRYLLPKFPNLRTIFRGFGATFQNRRHCDQAEQNLFINICKPEVFLNKVGGSDVRILEEVLSELASSGKKIQQGGLINQNPYLAYPHLWEEERQLQELRESLRSTIVNVFQTTYPGVPEPTRIKREFSHIQGYLRTLIYQWIRSAWVEVEQERILYSEDIYDPVGGLSFGPISKRKENRLAVLLNHFLDQLPGLTLPSRDYLLRNLGYYSKNRDDAGAVLGNRNINDWIQVVTGNQKLMDELSDILLDQLYRPLWESLGRLSTIERHPVPYNEIRQGNFKEFSHWAKPHVQRGIQIIDMLPTSRDDLVSMSINEGGAVANIAAQGEGAVAYDMNKLKMAVEVLDSTRGILDKNREQSSAQSDETADEFDTTVVQRQRVGDAEELLDQSSLKQATESFGYSAGGRAKGSIYSRAKAALAYSKKREYLDAAITASGRGDNFAKWVVRRSDLRSDLAPLGDGKLVAAAHSGFPNGDQPFHLMVKVPDIDRQRDWNGKEYILFNSVYTATKRLDAFKRLGWVGLVSRGVLGIINPAWWEDVEEDYVGTVYPFKWNVDSFEKQQEMLRVPNNLGGRIYLDETDKVRYSEVRTLVEAEAAFIKITRSAQSGELKGLMDTIQEESVGFRSEVRDSLKQQREEERQLLQEERTRNQRQGRIQSLQGEPAESANPQSN